MRLVWLAPLLLLPSWCVTCFAQSCPKLPELNFDRRSDLSYIDSLLTIGRTHRKIAIQLPQGRKNDTLRLEGLRFMSIVFKQMRGAGCDSSYIYAKLLEKQAKGYHNNLYVVRAMMLQEYYLRATRNNYPQALRINQQALELCKKIPPASSPCWQIQMNMGDIYRLLKEYDNALTNYRLSLTSLSANTSLSPKNRKLLTSQAISQMGEIYEIQGQYGKARSAYDSCRQIALETHSKVNLAYANERLGDFLINRHQPENAILVFDETLTIWNQLADRAGQASVWARLSECYTLTNKPNLAIEYGEKSVSVAREAGFLRIRQMATHSLYRAYRLTNQLVRALAIYDEYNQLTDSLENLKRLEELSVMQQKYAVDQVIMVAENERYVQQQQLTNVRREAELERVRAESERNQLAAKTRMNQLKQSIETERLKSESQKSRLEQRASIDKLKHDIEQADLLRIVLVGGMAMLWGFIAVYYRKNRLISRQKREIEGLNHDLEDKVLARTAELKLANDQLRAKNREIEEALLRGQTLERKRMAADLHDNLGGLLAAIRTSLSALNPDRMADGEQKIYHNLLTMSKEAFAEVRYLSHNLQPDELEKQGLAEALTRLVDKLNHTQKIKFHLDHAELSRLDKITEFNLYSICIELCSNTIRHSEATQSDILFKRFANELNMIVKDNGCGMNPDDATGMGLRNIQARMELIQGRYEVHSGAGEGTTFIFILPLNKA